MPLYYTTIIPHVALHVPDEELKPYLAQKWNDPPFTRGKGYGYTPHFSLLLENSCRASGALHLANANLLFAAAPLFSLSAPPPRRGHRLHFTITDTATRCTVQATPRYSF